MERVEQLDEKRSLPQWAADEIYRKILRGEYGPRSRLPSQRELASAMGISRPVLREAISMLEARGVLKARLGSGTYIASDSGMVTGQPSRRPDHESDTVSVGAGLTGSYSKLDVTRFRLAIEGACIRLAAMRITDADIAELEVISNDLKEHTRVGNFIDSALADAAFHQKIVETAGVPLFMDLYRAVNQMLVATLSIPPSTQSRGWEPVVEHERILEALRRRDPEEAVYYLKSHLTRSADRLGYVLPNEVL